VLPDAVKANVHTNLVLARHSQYLATATVGKDVQVILLLKRKGMAASKEAKSDRAEMTREKLMSSKASELQQKYLRIA